MSPSLTGLRRRVRSHALRALLTVLAPASLAAQVDPGIHRLTERDAALLQRYLPVLVQGRSAANDAYAAEIAQIDAFPAWRDSVSRGTLSLAALVRRRFGPITVPPDVTLDVECSMDLSDLSLGVHVLYFSREALGDAGRATRGVLPMLGEEMQRAVANADRNVPIVTRWEAFLLQNGYRKTQQGEGTYFLRVVQGDTLAMEVHTNSGCRSNAQKRLEPTVGFTVPFRELREGRRTPAAAPITIDGMLAADHLTEEALMERVSAALVAQADLRKGMPSANVTAEFQTPEIRANFAVREANMVWWQSHASALDALLTQYDRVSRQ